VLCFNFYFYFFENQGGLSLGFLNQESTLQVDHGFKIIYFNYDLFFQIESSFFFFLNFFFEAVALEIFNFAFQFNIQGFDPQCFDF